MGMTGNDCISGAAESQFSEKRSAKPHGRRDRWADISRRSAYFINALLLSI
jgi:hypothetical protein